MIADMLLTVTEIAVAAGAVAKFQLRIAYIGSAAYGAAVGVAGLGLFGFLFGKGNGTGLLDLFLLRLAILQLVSPLGRQNIDHITAEEQKGVGKGH